MVDLRWSWSDLYFKVNRVCGLEDVHSWTYDSDDVVYMVKMVWALEHIHNRHDGSLLFGTHPKRTHDGVDLAYMVNILYELKHM